MDDLKGLNIQILIACVTQQLKALPVAGRAYMYIRWNGTSQHLGGNHWWHCQPHWDLLHCGVNIYNVWMQWLKDPTFVVLLGFESINSCICLKADYKTMKKRFLIKQMSQYVVYRIVYCIVYMSWGDNVPLWFLFIAIIHVSSILQMKPARKCSVFQHTLASCLKYHN